jgi:hypothetical protein
VGISHKGYHSKRAEQELEQARSTASGCARRSHLELARLHAQLTQDESAEASFSTYDLRRPILHVSSRRT